MIIIIPGKGAENVWSVDIKALKIERYHKMSTAAVLRK